MTAPDHEPICGPSCDPMICHAGHCALEQANEHALRNKVRDTIHAASPTCTDYHAADCLPCTARAWLVMRLAVQPVLDAKDAQIAEARAYARYLDEDVIKPERALHEQTIKRAEDAEAERRDWQMAAQTAENELARLRAYHHQIGDQ